MSDKKERLKIDYFKEDPCNNCSQTFCQRLIDTCCRLKTDYEENSIAKQEAIEVMAKAMFEWQRPGCRGDVPIEDVWNNEQEGYEKLAEVALNALLKGVIKKKDNTVYELYTYNNGEKVTIGYSENMTDEKELETKYK